MKQITGHHVLGAFGLAFGTIIAVNLTLAINAVQTFPGLEARNSYVASQSFDANRAAQEALNWDVSAILRDDVLELRFEENGAPVAPKIEGAVFGRATSVLADQTPDFSYEDGVFKAPVSVDAGNWNLRVVAFSEDGTRFQQRLVVEFVE